MLPSVVPFQMEILWYVSNEFHGSLFINLVLALTKVTLVNGIGLL